MKGHRLEGQRTLQRFEQGHIFRDVIVLMADPLCDADGIDGSARHDHPNPGRPGVSQRAAIDVGHEIDHCFGNLDTTVRADEVRRQDYCLIPSRTSSRLCIFLWKIRNI